LLEATKRASADFSGPALFFGAQNQRVSKESTALSVSRRNKAIFKAAHLLYKKLQISNRQLNMNKEREMKKLVSKFVIMGLGFAAMVSTAQARTTETQFEVSCKIAEYKTNNVTAEQDLTNEIGVAGRIADFAISNGKVVRVRLFAKENDDDKSTFNVQIEARYVGANLPVNDVGVFGLKPQASKRNILRLPLKGVGDLGCYY